MEIVAYGGWKNNVRLANGKIELIATLDVGTRIIRFGMEGGKNIFGEMKPQIGGTGEEEWMIRGGHRLWLAPEVKPMTYELDNEPVKAEEIKNGVRIIQPIGSISGVRKIIEISFGEKGNNVEIVHVLKNEGKKTIECAPWALTVMAKKGMLVIPLPEKIPHTKCLTHNQEWSIWAYTDFSDPRWMLGSRYVFFKQDPERGPNKLGIAHRMGWVAYICGGNMFVKRFEWKEGGKYPDGGVNFETFANQDFLEIESLGPLVSLKPGMKTTHIEKWELYQMNKTIKTEKDVDKCIIPLIR